jgi:2'-5' RNA ligase
MVIAPLRYAVYLAPPPESALWRFGSAVVGRDAASGEAQRGFAPDGFDAEAWRGLTTEPRRYGFHATIKAPFRLAEDASRAELSAALADLAREEKPFAAGPLAVSTLALGGGNAFVALTTREPSPKVAGLEQRVVRGLDPFRAPLNDAERARRDPARLSERQRETFERWGYPYAFAEFRLHFTLTNALDDADRIAAALAREFAARVADPTLIVDALALFVQKPDGDFVIDQRFPLGG